MAPTRARLGQIGPLAATKRPNINPKCVVTISLTQADQLVAVGTKSWPLGPSDDLQGFTANLIWFEIVTKNIANMQREHYVSTFFKHR